MVAEKTGFNVLLDSQYLYILTFDYESWQSNSTAMLLEINLTSNTLEREDDVVLKIT